MPIYEYGCSGCGRKIEAFQRITEEPLTVCAECGGELKKLISNTSFVLKGSGWYVTDYASSDRKKAAEKEKAPAVEAQSKLEGKTETKTENKSKGKSEAKAA